MQLKCTNCGYGGSKAEFRYLSLAESTGPNSYRHCPKCRAAVYCEELEVGEQFSGKRVWGAGPLRGYVFRREPKGEQNNMRVGDGLRKP